jgi:hypothetical protein
VIADVYEAVDRMLWALLAWIAVFAFVCTLLLLSMAAGIAWAWRAPRKRSSGHRSVPEPVSVPRDPEAAQRPSGARACPSWSVGGVAPSATARRMLGAPLVDGGLGPHGGATDLLGLREVGDPVDEVVDALPVDAETRSDLVRREVAGDLHGSTIAATSSPSTARIE